MQDLFASGRIGDLILAVLVAEAVLLALLHARWGLGPGLRRMAANLVAGAALVVALRGALAGSDWMWIAIALSVALLAHATDLIGRWRDG